MNIKIITLPVHDALGITTVSTFTEAEARRIASIDFASFLPNTDMLAVALYCCHPSICAQYLGFPDGDYRKEAAEKAQTLHLKPSKIPPLARQGFFTQQLRMLLEIGNYNSDYGAKLIPVFAYMLEHAEEHCLDASLIGDIQRFMTKRDFVDGFVIIDQTTDTCTIMPSLWRKEVA